MKGRWRKLHDKELYNFYYSFSLGLVKKDYVERICNTIEGKKKP